MNWGRLALHGVSAIIGGLIVAAGLLLTDVPGRLRGGAGLTDGGRATTALENRIEALDRRIDGLAQLSGSDPLVRQMTDIRNRVAALQGEVGEGREGGTSGAAVQQNAEELIRLDTKLAQLAGEVTRTETRLSGRVAVLEALTPDDLPQMLDKAADKETVRALTARVAQLERDEMTRDVRSAARALALTNLMRAVETSRPFANELKAVEVLEPGNASVAALGAYAESGLPSVSTLTGRFDSVADKVVRSWRRAHGKGIFGRLWDDIIGLFRIRPVGEAEGMSAPALVARTEHRLQDGDLYMAVQELSKLGEPENAAAEDWLKAARSRLQLESLMAELNRQVLGEIAAAEAARRERREELAPAPSEAPSASEGAASERPAPGGSTSDDEPAPSPAPEAATPDAADESAPQSQDEADIGASER